MLTDRVRKTGASRASLLCERASDADCLRQRVVDAVSAILNGNDTAVAAMGHNGDALSLVATERKEEGVKLLIVRFDRFDDIFLALNSVLQRHFLHPFPCSFG